jgi:molybdate transport system substrate-binding protein
LGVQQITEILPVKGAVLVGPLPGSLQKVTTYSIMPTMKSANAEVFNQLRKFLQTPEATSLFKVKGFMVER